MSDLFWHHLALLAVGWNAATTLWALANGDAVWAAFSVVACAFGVFVARASADALRGDR